MLEISRLSTENLIENCVTDNKNPRFSFALKSDRQEAKLKKALITVNGWRLETTEQIAIAYAGKPLEPHTEYTVRVVAEDNFGEKAEREMTFRTGKLDESWQAKWITDGSYHFTKKSTSPKPLTFKYNLVFGRPAKKVEIYSTAVGIYKLFFNGADVGYDYFSPGFTSYKNQLQYQYYDITELAKGGGELTAVVAGGWAVGAYTHKRVNRIYADRQAFLCEIRVTFDDDTVEVFGSNKNWQITTEGQYKFAEFYDGETYDATCDLKRVKWKDATEEKIKWKSNITAQYGALVRAYNELLPICVTKSDDEIIYDFGQNIAGVIKATINGKQGQQIVFRHAEILQNGRLFTEALRSAKATATYICKDGEQSYSPKFTYMGFRYVSVSGIKVEDISLSALALSSDIERTGSFACSDERLNKLQSNIVWSARSNFIDIPTDCPQRDERMGWTGDIAFFSPTACFNFNMSRFFDKWLLDMRSEQGKLGGIPVIIPHVKVPGVFETTVKIPMDFWGDSCILVPWAEYRARGDLSLLRQMYPTMKKYIRACKFLAEFLSIGNNRRVWSFHHYGDWCAPEGNWKSWMARGKWTATACIVNSSNILSQIAGLIGEENDRAYYKKLSEEFSEGYRYAFTDGCGRLKDEFQTAYVLPLHFGVFEGEEKKNAAKNLSELVKKSDYRVGTGFPGTPYVLFALADNGYVDEAYLMLLNEECPSWLYEVKTGATTIWERWDALGEDGRFNNKDENDCMVSFNHYSHGAVGNFLYSRVAGIEPIEGGYKRFRFAPVIGGGLTHASVCLNTPYGEICASWQKKDGETIYSISVPVSCECSVEIGDKKHTLSSGEYTFTEVD